MDHRFSPILLIVACISLSAAGLFNPVQACSQCMCGTPFPAGVLGGVVPMQVAYGVEERFLSKTSGLDPDRLGGTAPTGSNEARDANVLNRISGTSTHGYRYRTAVLYDAGFASRTLETRASARTGQWTLGGTGSPRGREGR